MTRPYLAELRIFITVKYKLQKREKHKKGGCHHHSKYISGGKITNHLQEKSECLQLKRRAGLWAGQKVAKLKLPFCHLPQECWQDFFTHRIVSRPRCTCFMFYMSAWWQKDCVRRLASWSAGAFKQLSCQSQVQDHSSHQPQTKSLLKISKNILTFL